VKFYIHFLRDFELKIKNKKRENSKWFMKSKWRRRCFNFFVYGEARTMDHEPKDYHEVRVKNAYHF
jgi:hypothetical protein